MRLAFSTSVNPSWDLATALRLAREHGYQGIEIAALRGQDITPFAADLASDPAAVRQSFADAGVEPVCLGTPLRLFAIDAHEANLTRNRLHGFVRLAAQLGCPFVRVGYGDPPPAGDPGAAFPCVIEALRDAAPAAAEVNVTIVLENDAGFPGSRDLWYVLDAVGHPSVACCWNASHAMTIRERPTLSVPRLGATIRLVHVCDRQVGDDGQPLGYSPPGSGKAELPRLIALLRGIAYDGYVVFDWPRSPAPAPADPEAALATAAAFLRQQIEAKGEVLAAYKGDKTAPRYAPRSPRPPVRIR